MNRFELFTMVFYVLDYSWDQNQGEELRMLQQHLNGLPKKNGIKVQKVYGIVKIRMNRALLKL